MVSMCGCASPGAWNASGQTGNNSLIRPFVFLTAAHLSEQGKLRDDARYLGLHGVVDNYFNISKQLQSANGFVEPKVGVMGSAQNCLHLDQHLGILQPS
ncbi:hypothetical protein AMECASPLE_017912 [Ameca splendens]|uniref:Uncharacterized protein n=1 Tax=Ameca splendens TaxID=208324 RepID=A0ABV0ZYB5_9TELE